MAQPTWRDHLLSDSILRLSTCQDCDEICDIVAANIHALVPEGYVVVSFYDADLHTIRWRCDRGLDSHAGFFARLLGKERTDATFDWIGARAGDDEPSADTTGKLTAVPGGLYELLGGNVSRSVCTLVRRRLGIGSIHHAAFSLDGRPSGGVAILLKRGGVIREKALIEGIARHASVAIYRLIAEQEARLNAQRLELAAQSAHIGVWDLDLARDRLVWDARMFELYGVSRDGFQGVYGAWKDRVHPDDLPAADEAVSAAIRGEREFHTQFRVLRPDDEIRHIEAHGVVLRDHDGTPRRMIGVNWDVTNRKRAEDRLRAGFEGTIQAVSALTELRDPYTTGHQKEVARLACAIADSLKLSSDRIEGIRAAGLLHDIGKIAVPAEVLAKPGKLTPTEFGLIQGHPQAAYDVLKNIEFPWPVADIVIQHHESLDGSGYPMGLRGPQILLEARILSVADMVEAMCSHRPYREALGLDSALTELRANSGVRYDVDVVDACFEVFACGEFTFSGETAHAAGPASD